jgi:hypothetical protein
VPVRLDGAHLVTPELAHPAPQPLHGLISGAQPFRLGQELVGAREAGAALEQQLCEPEAGAEGRGIAADRAVEVMHLVRRASFRSRQARLRELVLGLPCGFGELGGG